METQAFGYKNNQKGCVYVITSNFEKLRFYIEDSVEHLEFDLFKLSADDFDLLYLCLQKDNLLANLPAAIKAASVNEEQNVTKKLYNDYSSFKRKLYLNITELNPQFDKVVLYKKTQKLLDRFLFILFAEDKQLLPPNSIREILNQWQQLKELDEHVPLYDRYKKYFGYMNTGHKGKQHDIFAYNGGLFAPDEVLDNITVDDQLLHDSTFALSQYDYETEVDVNILGHIFEHSLNDVDAVTAEYEGKQVEKDKTRRKKDGVFYTPKYITKYIVENTVGKLCEEKKTELEIKDEDYSGGKKKKDKKALNDKLETYRKWLLVLTIHDPACGSGAFLNQALEFLIAEHRKVDELRSKLFEDSMVLSDVENHILENNLYGVDLNEESIEIAKLSLWLRTAKRGRKLSSLNNNIKCGNSLIDDPAVAGDKAFNWQKEFETVFTKGGFDVVIGNPPYGAQLDDSEKEQLVKEYDTYEYQVNTYVLFYERGMKILSNRGMLGYITPATFTYQHFFKKLRIFLQRYKLVAVGKYCYEVFDDADIGDSVTWIQRKEANNQSEVVLQVSNTIEDTRQMPISVSYDKLVGDDGIYTLSYNSFDFRKLSISSKILGEIANIVVGIKPYQTGKGKPKQTPEDVVNKRFTSTQKLDDSYIQCINGKDFERYKYIQEPEMYLSYGSWLAEPREGAPFFEADKIIIRQTSDSLIAHLDNKQRINLNNVYNVGSKDSGFDIRYIIALLNSKLLNYYYQSISQEKGRVFAEVKKVNLAKLPIKVVDESIQLKFIDRANKLINCNEILSKHATQFLSLLQRKFELPTLSNKLQEWYELDFKSFLKELEKAKVKMSLAQEAEWLSYFTEQKQKALTLKTEIDKTDKEIDKMVYELYGLTEEEIKIVEGKG